MSPWISSAWIRQVRFTWRLVGTFIRRHVKLMILGIAGGIGLSAGLFFLLPNWEVPKETIRVGLVGSYDSASLPDFIQNQISVGLTKVDENQEVVSGLAESWKAEEDGKVWVFKIADDLYWQDGTKVTARDINYDFSDVKITVLSDNEIKFELKDPFAPLPAVVSKPVFKRGLLGSGEYQVKKLKEARGNLEQLDLVSKNDESPNLVYKFYATEMMAKLAFKLGEVDELVEVSDEGDFEGWKNVKIEPGVHLDRYVAIFFNTTDEALADKSIRQALAYGVNKGREGKERAISPIYPLSWGFNSQVKRYEYDQEKAAKLLKDNLPPGKQLEINLVALPSLLTEAEKIKQDWEKIGVKTLIQVSNYPPESYQAILVTESIGMDPDQYSLWHSSQKGSNLARLENLRIDKLLEDGRKTLERDRRLEIYFDFQRFLLEESPAVFLYHPVTFRVIRSPDGWLF